VGLIDALATYTHEWSATSGIPVDLVPINMAETRLPTVIETTVYRIAQEALTNVLKHAHASQASVVVERRNATLHVVIADNGEGFEPGERSELGVGGRHIGLLNMSERAALAGGELTIESAPDSGTTVMLRIPLPHDAPQHAHAGGA
jgi:signal transduction histidine kinase